MNHIRKLLLKYCGSIFAPVWVAQVRAAYPLENSNLNVSSFLGGGQGQRKSVRS